MSVAVGMARRIRFACQSPPRRKASRSISALDLCKPDLLSNESPLLFPVVPHALYVAQYFNVPHAGTGYVSFMFVQLPLTLNVLLAFIDRVDGLIAFHVPRHDKIIFCAGNSPHALADAAFLLGARMLLKGSGSLATVERMLAPLINAAVAVPSFACGASLRACWEAVACAVAVGWVAPSTPQSPHRWGRYDMRLHRAFHGTVKLRELAPGHYVAFFDAEQDLAQCALVLKSEKVSDVVFWHDEDLAGDMSAFVKLNIKCHYITVPPNLDATREALVCFASICDNACGKVAVHCRAFAPRRSCTFLALMLMRDFGFSAVCAAAWLRLVWPRAAVNYTMLCDVERRVVELVQEANK